MLGRVIDLEQQRAQLERWRAGRIVTVRGRLWQVEQRWLGYRASLVRVWWDKLYKARASRRAVGARQEFESASFIPKDDGKPAAARFSADRCELYYHHAWTSADFLVLGYVTSHAESTLSSFYCATLVLDEIARVKRSNAIVAQLTNDRISDRLMIRWGWQRHCHNLPGRHFIKRLYGSYPTLPVGWQERVIRGVCEK